MKNIICSLIFIVGAFAQAFAQQTPQAPNDSTQAGENEMMCFLTDESTITCFVAPEDAPSGPNGGQSDNIFEEETPQQIPGDKPLKENKNSNSATPEEENSRKERRREKNKEEAPEELAPGDVKMI